MVALWRRMSGVARGLLIVDLAGALLLTVVTPSFTSTYNLFITGRYFSILILVALAQMIVLAVGQMNLSIGAIGGLVAIVESGLMVSYDTPVVIAIAFGLVLGAACGAVNGLLIHWTKVNSFILTLGTSYVFAGINLGITHATPFYHIPGAVASFGQARIGAFPDVALVTIVLAVALAVFLRQTVLGRQLLAVGGNPVAAALSGLPVRRVVRTAPGISGFFGPVAGTLLKDQLGEGQPTIGVTRILAAFACPIIGRAVLARRSAPPLGTVFAIVSVLPLFHSILLLNANT